jgi:3-deoxy-D-manno-octulosonic-acid transferase
MCAGAEVEFAFDRVFHPLFLRRREFWLTDLLADESKARPFRRCLIVYAPVAGQVMSIIPLANLLRQRFPSMPLLVCSQSAGALAVAESAGLDAVRITAINRRQAAKLMRAISPSALILVQLAYTGMPTALVKAFSERELPVAQVNGAVTDQNLDDVGGWKHPYIVDAYPHITQFCVQTEMDASRMQSLGAPSDKITVAGDLKADAVSDVSPEVVAALADHLNVNGSLPFIIAAGSTHAGEESALFQAFRQVCQVTPDARLIIAPRRVERSDEIVALCAQMGFSVEKRTSLNGKPSVIVLDTMGELRAAYRLASVAFVGATLTSTGGHNILEPAAAGIPVVFGPHIENIRGYAEDLLENGGGFGVSCADELGGMLVKLAADESLRLRSGRSALEVVAKAQGAAERCADIISGFLPADLGIEKEVLRGFVRAGAGNDEQG